MRTSKLVILKLGKVSWNSTDGETPLIWSLLVNNVTAAVRALGLLYRSLKQEALAGVWFFLEVTASHIAERVQF